MTASKLPLDGIRVVEFAHMVMGPSCGLVLADLGAEVIKVEPLEGDNTRRLEAAGAGFFPIFNRNKKSLAVDLKSDDGRALVLRLLDGADVLTENFRPGALERMGFGYTALAARNPRLIYCSLKGFLDGPYQDRAALDEVMQMMARRVHLIDIDIPVGFHFLCPGYLLKQSIACILSTVNFVSRYDILAAWYPFQPNKISIGNSINSTFELTGIALII